MVAKPVIAAELVVEVVELAPENAAEVAAAAMEKAIVTA